ncbi:MAG: chorismate mutase [Candidatus Latescibacteria bacterium]|jgi:chorismate mutase-like protein|nr:chorismate mutase [Candidatus Latescibacterota bacterium]
MEIDDWREQIDELDSKLLDLFNRRARCALEIGKIKNASGQPIRVPEREAAILERLKDLNSGPLSDGAVGRLFGQIIEEMRDLEDESGTDASDG